MKRAAAVSCLVFLACGGPPPRETTPTASTREVRVAEDATVGELLRELRTALTARGHDGECFLAWDLEAEPDAQITVHVGERFRSAAVSCNSLQAVATELEGRCPFVRFFWIAGEDMRTEALTFYFAPAGRAFASRAVGGAPVTAPASEAVFREGPEGTRLVLGVPLPERASAAKQASEPDDAQANDTQANDAQPRDAQASNPLEDPEIMEGLQQVVARIQRCNPSGEGSLVLEWQVEQDGTIADVHPVTATVPESAVECAIEMLTEASFPEHERERAVDYCVPVMLDPSLRPADQAGRGE